MLESMAETVKNIPNSDELAVMIDLGKPRPKANMKELDPQKVYTVENVVGLDTMKLIPVRQWVESIKAKRDVRTSSRFVARRVQNQASNTEKLKLLRYMLLLLDFYNNSSPIRGGRKLPKREDLKKILGDVPEAVLEGVKRKFSQGGTMNKAMANSLIMHLCALACMVDNCEVDTWDLKEDLKLETKEMSLYFHEVGAKITTLGDAERKRLGLEKAAAAQHRVAKLKVPLDFPKTPQGKKRR
jgi:DNA-directed RNA polymerase I subunit RPA49